jgi:hypothetical protein
MADDVGHITQSNRRATIMLKPITEQDSSAPRRRRPENLCRA